MQILNYRNIIFFIIIAEILSFLGYYFAIINYITFFIIVFLTIILSFRNLKYGLLILLTELFIGSFGYLFYFEYCGYKISIRIALWLVIMLVWIIKIISELIKTRKIQINFLKLSYFNYFIILFIFIALGVINGLVNKNNLGNIFFDLNNWFYFLLIFPIFSVIQNNKQTKQEGILENIGIKQVFFASIIWLSIKTLILTYFFSHNFNNFIFDLYTWIRTSHVGEITYVQGGFYRIFMQSHIFVLLGFIILLFYLLKSINEQKKIFIKDNINTVGLLSLFLAVILVSFSRSFWVGLMIGIIFFWLIALFKLKTRIKQFIFLNFLILLSILMSCFLIMIIINFPFPSTIGKNNVMDLLNQRITNNADESAISSRWQLLSPLLQKIKINPILGQGFGTTITFKSNDPRVLASNPDGKYTTYAFEWGWLDVWLKLGFIGLFTYLFIYIRIIFDNIKTGSYFSLSLAAGLVVIMIVNIFSPYVNHPLGIGYLIIITAILGKRSIN